MSGEVLTADVDPFPRSDGALQWIRWEIRPWYADNHSVGGILIFAEEVTERKRAEEAVRESEERFRALVTASSDVVYRMSPDWSEMRQLQGREFIADTKEPSRTWLEKYIYPEDQPHVMRVINDALRTKTMFQLEHRVRRLDGTEGWTFSRAVPLLDAAGEIVEWFGAASDITERKRAEEAVRESEAFTRSILESSADCIKVLDFEAGSSQ